MICRLQLSANPGTPNRHRCRRRKASPEIHLPAELSLDTEGGTVHERTWKHADAAGILVSAYGFVSELLRSY